MVWKAVACSSVGTSHQKQHVPCQDYSDWRIFNNVVVGAVADGAGSAKYADLGAKLAVNTVLKYLSRIQLWLQKRQSSWQLTSRLQNEAEARKVFTRIVKLVVTVLRRQAASKGYSINELACTLLIVVATPNWISAMQIGDGFIVRRCQDELPQLLFSPDKGEYINQTTFVTSAHALKQMRVYVRTGRQEFICASTDGLERLAIQANNSTPFVPFFQPLENYLRANLAPEQEDEYLRGFLNSERLNLRADDDKTLLLCLYDACHSR